MIVLENGVDAFRFEESVKTCGVHVRQKIVAVREKAHDLFRFSVQFVLKLGHVADVAIVLQNTIRIVVVPQFVFNNGVPRRKREQLVLLFDVVRQRARSDDARVG